MKQYILLLLTVSMAQQQWQCTCEQLMTEYDCMTQYRNRYKTGDIDTSQICFWYQDQCQNMMNYLSDISCSSLTQQECSAKGENVFTQNPVCVWYSNTDSACSKFTRCQDYTYQSAALALSECKNLGCTANGTTCSFDYRGRQDQQCRQLTTQAECETILLKDKYTICQWNNKTCNGLKFELCSDLTTQFNCNQASVFCSWKQEKCVERICADMEYQYLSQTQICTSFYSLQYEKYIYCKQDITGCIEATPDTFSQQQCNYQSRFTHLWNTTSNSCYPCLYISDQSILQLLIIVLLLII